MDIKNIRIDGYGPWSDLSLEGLTPGLNVFFGPPGSGKSLLRRCICSILNGFGDHVPNAASATSHAVVGGTLSIRGATGRYDISRYHDGTRQGRLLIRSADGTSHDPGLLASLRQLPQPTFAGLLDVDFHSRPSMRRLLQTISAAGLLAPTSESTPYSPTDGRIPYSPTDDRIPFSPTDGEAQRAAQALDAARRRLRDHAASQPPDGWEGRRSALLADIDRLTDQLASGRSEPTVARQSLLDDVARHESEVRRLRDALRELEETSPAAPNRPNRSPAATPPHPAPPAPDSETSRLVSQLESLDQQVRRWRRIEHDVEQRRAALRDELTQWEMNHARPPGEAKSPRRRLATLEQQISQLEQQLGQLGTESALGCVCRPTLERAHPLVRQLREQLYLLCQELTQQQRHLRRESLVNELKQLRRCRLELGDHLRRLTQRRKALLARYGRSDEAGLELYRRSEANDCECSDHESYLRGERSRGRHEVPLSSEAWHEEDSRQAEYRAREYRVREAEWAERHRQLTAQLAAAEERLEAARGALAAWRGPSPASELTAALAECRAELAALEARRDAERDAARGEEEELKRLVRHWEQVVAELSARPAEARDLMDLAAGYLRRMSGGKYVELSGTGQEGMLWITSHDGQVYPHDVLGPQTYDQVYLSLRMAVASVHAGRGIRVPLILDDPFLHIDVQQHPEVLEVLSGFVEKDGQVLLFTGDPVAARLLSERDHWVRDLVPSTSGRRSRETPRPRQAETRDRSKQVVLLRNDWDPEEFPGELADRILVEEQEARDAEDARRRRMAERGAVVERPWTQSRRFVRELLDEVPGEANAHERPANGNGEAAPWKFYLETSSPIEDAPSIGRRMAEQLRGIGVTQVSDLLALSPKGAAAQLAHLTVPSETIRAWQAQAWLVCCVPHLRPYDARILVACGITDPDQLQQMEPRDLLARVERFLVTREGRRMVESGNDYELARISSWIRMARQTRRRWERKQASSRPPRSGADPAGRPYAPRTAATDDRGPRGNFAGQASGHRYLSVGSHAANRPRLWEGEPASSGTETRASRTSPAGTPPAPNSSANNSANSLEGTSEGAESEWSFYLHQSSPVVDAPAIGPRTAERLEAIGIVTVADLLDADPRRVAERLDYHRIKAETIRQWQAQARLVCRIPHLRGHDAQILVACGYHEPEQLQALSVDELYAVVAPFVATREGERIIRSGRRPDRDEVADWLRWARQTRPLRAA